MSNEEALAKYVDILRHYNDWMVAHGIEGGTIYQVGGGGDWEKFESSPVLPILPTFDATPVPPAPTGWYPLAERKPVADGNWETGRQGQAIKAVVLHVAEGTYEGACSWFNNPAAGVSSHFLIGKNGKVAQFLSIRDTAYGNGLRWQDGKWWYRGANDYIEVVPTWQGITAGVNPNLQTISIEHEGKTGEPMTWAMARTQKYLMGWIAQQTKLVLAPHVALISHSEINPKGKPNCSGVALTPDIVLKNIMEAIVTEIPDNRAPWLKIERHPGTTPYWKITNVDYRQAEPAHESDGTCNAYVRGYKDGKIALGAVAQLWSRPPLFDEFQAEKVLELKPEPTGDKAGTDFYISNSFDPANAVGPCAIQMKGESDRLTGLGLPLKRHDGWFVTFEWTVPSTQTFEQALIAWMKPKEIAINDQTALFKYGKAQGLGDAETTQFGPGSDSFVWQGVAYIAQSFSRGIIYLQESEDGQWDKIKHVVKPQST